MTQSIRVAQVARPRLLDRPAQASHLRLVGKLGVAVVLVAAGLLIGAHVSPQIGGTLVASGVETAFAAVLSGHEGRQYPRRRAAFELALG